MSWILGLALCDFIFWFLSTSLDLWYQSWRKTYIQTSQAWKKKEKKITSKQNVFPSAPDSPPAHRWDTSTAAGSAGSSPSWCWAEPGAQWASASRVPSAHRAPAASLAGEQILISRTNRARLCWCAACFHTHKLLTQDPGACSRRLPPGPNRNWDMKQCFAGAPGNYLACCRTPTHSWQRNYAPNATDGVNYPRAVKAGLPYTHCTSPLGSRTAARHQIQPCHCTPAVFGNTNRIFVFFALLFSSCISSYALSSLMRRGRAKRAVNQAALTTRQLDNLQIANQPANKWRERRKSAKSHQLGAYGKHVREEQNQTVTAAS